MPTTEDFRLSPFHIHKVGSSGKLIGKKIYWKLYTIENTFRILIHSVLSVQINPEWWTIAVDRKIQNKAQQFQNNYFKKAWHGKPGKHSLYYIDLRILMK